MKMDIKNSYMTKFGEISIGDEFVYEDKKYRKLKTFTFEVEDGLNYCVNAIVLDSSKTYKLVHFGNSMNIEVIKEPVFIKFKDLDVGDIFIHKGTVAMKVQPTIKYIVDDRLASSISINSIDLSTGLFYKWFDDSDSVEKIIDYDFKIVRR